MNRIEFMTTLASLLQDIPAEERREAMQYYNDYFDEAGMENEAAVIKELGDPEKVAAIIKEGLEGFDENAGEFTDTGYHDPKYEEQDVPEPRVYHSESEASDKTAEADVVNEKGRWTSKPLKIILIIAIILCAVPVLLPIVMGLVAAVAGITLAFCGLLLAIVVASAAVVIAGVAVFITGLIHLFSEFAAGLALTGLGLILIPLGAIATVASVKLCMAVFPAMIRGFVKLCRKPFHRKAVA